MIPSRPPFTIDDYSGGMTDLFTPGDSNKYREAVNLWITKNKKLESRWGSEIFGPTNYRLPVTLYPVERIIPFDRDSELFVVAGRDLFYQDPDDWNDLLGPDANQAFPSNTEESQVSSAEWRKHLLLATDSGDQPIKIFRDETDTLQLLQAGLPQPEFVARYDDAALLAAAITLAVNLKTAMVTHAQDDGALGTANHLAEHTSLITALNALSAPVTENDLATYVSTLKTHYDAHIDDAQLFSGQAYHIDVTANVIVGDPFKGIFPLLNFNANTTLAAPTDLDTAVACLNDLRNRFNWHTWAINTHGDAYLTVTSGFGKHDIADAVIENPTGPLIDPSLGVLLSYANAIKGEYDTHVTRTLIHNVIDTEHEIVAPDATDMHSLVTLLVHLKHFYWRHYESANFDPNGEALNYITFTGTAASASDTFTSTSIDGSDYIGYYYVRRNAADPFDAWSIDNEFFSPSTAAVTVTAGTATTVEFSDDSELSQSGTFVLCLKKTHFDRDTTSTAALLPIDIYQAQNAYSLSLDDIDAFTAEFAALYACLKSHVTGQLVAADDNDSSEVQTYQDPYATGALAPTVSAWIPHAPHGFGAVGLIFPMGQTVNGQTVRDDYFTAPPESESYLYRFVWANTYQVGSIEFLDRSAPSAAMQLDSFPSFQDADPAETALYPIELSDLPELTNTALTHYPTSSMVLEIYRSAGDGQTMYKVGEVANGDATFSDEVMDETIEEGERLYTTGGVVANDEPPPSKFVHVIGELAYYAYTTEDGEEMPHRVRQSVDGDTDACPALFFTDVDDVITGLNSFRSKPLVFCARSFFRIEGRFNELSQGFMTAEALSEEIGAVNNASIVRTELGVFFASETGFFWTDGLTYLRISDDLEVRYASMVRSDAQKRMIRGCYDKARRRILWTMMANPGGSYPDQAWVLDLRFGIKPSMPFTTMSGQSFRPTALAVYDNAIIRGDDRAYLFRHLPHLLDDPKIDETAAATDWSMETVIYRYQSCQWNFGTDELRKYCTSVLVKGHGDYDLSLAITSRQDGKRTEGELAPIRYRGDGTGMISESRKFNAGTLRCDWRELEFTNAWVAIENSDSLGVATVDATNATVDLDDLDAHWDLDPIDYAIAFETDDYETEYTVLERVSDTQLLVDDPEGTLEDVAGVKWVLRGYPKGEKLSLLSYAITYTLLGQHAAYGGPVAEGGSNAG